MSSLKFSKSLTDLFKFSFDQPVTDRVLNRLMQTLDAKFKPLEDQQASLAEAQESLRTVGLNRINDILTPAIESILEVQERGFLIANSSTSATLANGDILTFVVSDESQRRLFTPSPFTALTREGSYSDYGIARTVSYDADRGEYLCEVMSVSGDPGPHSDWVIGAMAGPTIAMLQYLADAETARSGAEDAARVAGEERATAVGAAETATDERKTTSGLRLAASQDAQRAKDAADHAETFDPAKYATLTALTGETEARLEAINAERQARQTAIAAEVEAREEAIAAEVQERTDAIERQSFWGSL